MHIVLDASDLASDKKHLLTRLVQTDLDELNDSVVHRLNIVTAKRASDSTKAEMVYVDTRSGEPINHQLAVVVYTAPESSSENPIFKLQPYDSVLEVHANPASTSSEMGLQSLARSIAENLRTTFAEERETITHILASDAAFARSLGLQEQASATYELQQRSNRAFKYASTYHLTFSLFSGSATPSSWDIKTALDAYLDPFLDSFSSISKFTVDTQVQLYASLSSSISGPSYDEASNQWTLLQSDLSAFVNAAEWPLSPSIGAGPTINFVVYVPSESQTPLVIRETGGTSWLIPQWGGVQILNPAAPGQPGNHTVLNVDALEPVMRIFADQLDSLLGLPSSPASLPLRLSSLARERTASLVLSASSTLGALARLTLKLTSIAIPDNVAGSVAKSLQHLEQTCNDLHQGRFDSALEHARFAESHAERAFFDPSMVGQVYFPDEHKVAVYVPLLGPMAVPLAMAAIKELKRIQQTRSFSR